MVGTLFLWMFWPSFNGALAPSVTQERVFINTVLALTGSCIGAFIWSQFKRRKLSMVDVQNATLAGGVAVGSAADLSIDPWAAILVGLVSSAVSVWGYTVLQPWLEHKFHLHDTCGVHNLHGMPGIIGGISGAIAAASAGNSVYGTNIGVLYPARGVTQDRSAGEQGGYQFLALVITLIIAIASGILVGNIVSHPIFEPPAPKDYYSDHLYVMKPAPVCVILCCPSHHSHINVLRRIRYWEDVHDPSQEYDGKPSDPDRVEGGEQFLSGAVQESVI
jgi:ammonium transporter Rh